MLMTPSKTDKPSAKLKHASSQLFPALYKINKKSEDQKQHICHVNYPTS